MDQEELIKQIEKEKRKKAELDNGVRKKFDEERARLILAQIFPEELTDTVLSDRPDIQTKDGRIGIEVTDATLRPVRQNLAMVSRITGKTRDQLNRHETAYLGQDHVNDSDWQGMTLPGFALWGPTVDYAAAYQKKVESMQKEGYGSFEKNGLFIYSMIGAEDSEVQAFIQQVQSDEANPYDLMLLCFEHSLKAIQYKPAEVRDYPLTAELWHSVNHAAFLTAVGIEYDEFYPKEN